MISMYARLGFGLWMVESRDDGQPMGICGLVKRDALDHVVTDLFPGGGDVSRATFWTGLRPMTPDGPPVIGPTRYANLFLNTGHGTLCWTHACGSGKSIARIVSGLRPEVDFAFTGLAHETQGGGARRRGSAA